jgi:hypothetical protein
MGWCGPIRQPAPAAGTKGQPAAQREQEGEEPNRPAGMSGTSSDEQSGRPDYGTKRRRSAKRAVIRTARSARPLSAISP